MAAPIEKLPNDLHLLIIDELRISSVEWPEDLLFLSLASKHCYDVATPHLRRHLGIILEKVSSPPWLLWPSASGQASHQSHRTMLLALARYLKSITRTFGKTWLHNPKRYQGWAFRQTAPKEPYPLPCIRNDHCETFFSKSKILARLDRPVTWDTWLQTGWIEGFEADELEEGSLIFTPTFALCTELKALAKTAAITLRYARNIHAIWVSTAELDQRIARKQQVKDEGL